MLITLVDDCQIFENVTVKKFQIPSRAERMAAAEKTEESKKEKPIEEGV